MISNSGLLTIAGGKWTTYRQMAEDCVNHAATLAGLDPKPCVTKRLNIHGYHKNPQKFGSLGLYGADAPAIQDLLRADLARQQTVHPALTALCGEVIWAARFEAARTIEDFLARRTRSLFVNARAAIQAAPRVAALMAKELGHNQHWESEQVKSFQRMSAAYLPTRISSA
jgi:glycerol-3-phosphate dehydrogenase